MGNGLSLGSELQPGPAAGDAAVQWAAAAACRSDFLFDASEMGLGSASTNQGPGITGSGPIRGGCEAPAPDTGDASDE